MNSLEPITVSVTVPCSAQDAWSAFTSPTSIQAWNFASDDWHCPSATSELRPGGSFSYRMEAKDGSMGFDYCGTFLEVAPFARLRLALGPEREVLVEFKPTDRGTVVSQTFTPESTFPLKQQREGWQAIMDNYRIHAAGRTPGKA